MQETNEAKQHVLEKFKKRGFHHLTLEELAITQICPTWAEDFKAATSEDWSIYQEKAADRLKRSKFNIKWLTKDSSSSFSNLFSIVTRGDMKLLEEYIRINDLKACIKATDDSKKTCLHIACREGNADIVEYLVSKGWALEARDKLLSTPLQQASSSGYPNIVSFLLLKGADPRAKDTLGRNSLLFAVCSPSADVVEVLIKHDVSLLDSRDYSGRSALHYTIFNPHPRQVDVIRTLLEAGIPVDIPDNELKTPLHHACESSKPRGIRLLLKWGANPNTKDKNGKTPGDLANNQSIKQLLALYTKPKTEEKIQSSRISSEKLPKISKKANENRPTTPVQQTSQVFSVFRDKLLVLLRKVQEAGVQSNQHIKKPSLYSGAWVEGILNTSALNNELASTPSCESVIKVFNVLFPYPKNLPIPEEDDISGLEFFGPGTYKTPRQEAVYIQDDGKVFRLQQQLEAAEQNIKELQQLISSKDRLIQELQTALKTKTNDHFDLQNNLQELKEKHLKTLKQIPTTEEIQAKQKEKENILQQLESYKVKLDESEKREKELKMLAERLKMDLSQRPSIKDVEVLKESIAMIEADNKNLRFKAGQIFLNGLDNDEENDPASAESHLQDDEILQRLENALRGNPPSFKQRLADADSNKDGKITKGELVKLLGSLSLPPQDVIVLCRIAGFRKGVSAVSNDSFVNILASREQRKENLEGLLFSKLASIFDNHSLSIDQAFEYLDVNKDGFISFQELSSACEYLKLDMSREDRHALFAVLDSDHNGTISLQELKEKIGNPPDIPKPVLSGKPANTRYSEAKDPTPASSERNSEPPAIEKKSLGKTLPENEKTNAVKDQKNNSKKVNGSLVIGVVRGKDLGPGSYSVEARIEGAEKSAKTPLVPGPNPNWKYKGRIRLYDTSTALISGEIVAEVNNEKGLVGYCRVPWNSTLDFPNAWAVKSEYPVTEPNGRKHGSLFIHLMWCPKDGIRVEGSGVLSIQVVSYSGFPKSMLQFNIGASSATTTLEKNSLARIKNLVLKSDEPIPSLKCSVLNATNKQVVIWRNLSVEVALATKDWTSPLQVPLNEGYLLTLRFLWVPQTIEEENTFKAVVKIQAMFRGMRARKNLAVLKKPIRKVLSRKAISSNKRYFLLSIIEEDDNLLLELHKADDPDCPMHEVISSLKCDKIPVESIYKNLNISDTNEMSLKNT